MTGASEKKHRNLFKTAMPDPTLPHSDSSSTPFRMPLADWIEDQASNLGRLVAESMRLRIRFGCDVRNVSNLPYRAFRVVEALADEAVLSRCQCGCWFPDYQTLAKLAGIEPNNLPGALAAARSIRILKPPSKAGERGSKWIYFELDLLPSNWIGAEWREQNAENARRSVRSTPSQSEFAFKDLTELTDQLASDSLREARLRVARQRIINPMIDGTRSPSPPQSPAPANHQTDDLKPQAPAKSEPARPMKSSNRGERGSIAVQNVQPQSYKASDAEARKKNRGKANALFERCRRLFGGFVVSTEHGPADYTPYWRKNCWHKPKKVERVLNELELEKREGTVHDNTSGTAFKMMSDWADSPGEDSSE